MIILQKNRNSQLNKNDAQMHFCVHRCDNIFFIPALESYYLASSNWLDSIWYLLLLLYVALQVIPLYLLAPNNIGMHCIVHTKEGRPDLSYIENTSQFTCQE